MDEKEEVDTAKEVSFDVEESEQNGESKPEIKAVFDVKNLPAFFEY